MRIIASRFGRVGTALAFSLLTFALVAPTASARCVLQANDFVSLRKSKSGLKNQAQVDAMSEFAQTVLCQTRDMWRRAHANGNKLDGPPVRYSATYLSSTEQKIMVKLINDYIAAKLGVTPKQ
jgi:hypothetical protein